MEAAPGAALALIAAPVLVAVLALGAAIATVPAKKPAAHAAKTATNAARAARFRDFGCTRE
jgi:hypothetical protein